MIYFLNLCFQPKLTESVILARSVYALFRKLVYKTSKNKSEFHRAQFQKDKLFFRLNVSPKPFGVYKT